jgi:hypothetical protein
MYLLHCPPDNTQCNNLLLLRATDTNPHNSRSYEAAAPPH